MVQTFLFRSDFRVLDLVFGSTAALLQVVACQSMLAQDWPAFRGGDANGVVEGAQLPTRWSETENVLWRTPIHGRGWSSPVVDAGEVWLTTATEDGLKMYVICLNLDTGEVIQDRLLFENESVQPDYHETNSYASPTPVLHGEYAYLHFGAYGTICMRRNDGKIMWTRRDIPCNHYRGPGSSPIVYQGLLIFHMDGFDWQYAVALNCKTGETVWKANRNVEYGTDNGDFFKAYSTPLIIRVGQQDQLISPASMSLLALEPLTGKEIWRVRYEEHSTTVRPVYDGRRIFFSTGFSKAKMMSVRVDGQGDVTDSHVEWIEHRGIGCKPSPVLVGNRLFVVTDDGVISRLDLETGETLWRQRLGGKFSASLVASSDHVVATDHDGKSYVFTVADSPELVSENSLSEGCNASPAIAGDSLLLRTTSALYRIKKR